MKLKEVALVVGAVFALLTTPTTVKAEVVTGQMADMSSLTEQVVDSNAFADQILDSEDLLSLDNQTSAVETASSNQVKDDASSKEVEPEVTNQSTNQSTNHSSNNQSTSGSEASQSTVNSGTGESTSETSKPTAENETSTTGTQAVTENVTSDGTIVEAGTETKPTETLEAKSASEDELLDAKEVVEEEELEETDEEDDIEVEDTLTTKQLGFTEEDIRILAHVMRHEANNQPEAGKIAILEVVMNRVKDSRFPNTIEGVVYQPGQFTNIRKIKSFEPTLEERALVLSFISGQKMALNNQNALYFKNPWTCDKIKASVQRNWGKRKWITYIGDHAFYEG